jgi:hypothetical protein
MEGIGMARESIPDTNRIDKFIEAGLSKQEAELALTYTGALRPQDLESPRELFIRGQDCESIAKVYPQFTIKMLLAARGTFGWDSLRKLEANRKATESLMGAGLSQPTALIFLSRVIEIVNKKYEMAMLEFLAKPDSAPFPDVAKADFDRIEKAIILSRDILGLTKVATKNGISSGNNQIVNIVLKDKNKEVTTVEVDQEAVAASLILEMNESKARAKAKGSPSGS